MATAKKWVYFFGNKKAEGRAEQKNLLGGKGANLHEMTRLGIPVPGGFTITTEACIYYTSNKKQYPQGMWKQAEEALKKLDMAILYQNTEEYEKFVRQDFESIGKVVKALGLDKK